MSHTSSTLVPIPTRPVDPNFGHLRIIDDVLYPKGEAPYLGRDLQVRIALFVITQLVPVIATAILTFSMKGWWRWKSNWTMSRFVVFWLLSIQFFGSIIYFQKGASTRLLFISATLHLQVEYMIIALLLKCSGLKALLYAYIGGTLLYTIVMFVPDLSLVYIMATTCGFTDFFLPLLFLYGKQHLYAIGGFAHLVQAVAVFCSTVKNYGHGWFNLLIFSTTWIMNGVLVAAVLRTRQEAAAIRLPDNGLELTENGVTPIKTENPGEASDNPLSGINVPPKVLAALFGATVTGSFVSALFFVFVVARN